MPKIPTRNKENAQEEIKIFGMPIKEDSNLKGEEFELRNSVQRIPIIKIDATAKQLKYLKKCYIKAFFTRWERIKMFFMGIKI